MYLNVVSAYNRGVAGDLTDVEVARALRKHPRTIQRWCKAGKLPGAYKAGRAWRIPRRSLRSAQLSRAFGADQIERELGAAALACGELAEELDALEVHVPPPLVRNWRRADRALGELQRALGELQRALAVRERGSVAELPARWRHRRARLR